MRSICTILFAITLEMLYSQVGTGIATDKITVWRFLEQTENGTAPKMLIFNNTDSLLMLVLRQGPLSDIENRVIAEHHEIEPEGHEVFRLPAPSDHDEFLSFSINGKEVGLLDAWLPLPPKNLKPGKYFSNEGLNGGGDELWVSRNRLISSGTTSDTTVLHLNYFDQAMYKKDGFQTIELFGVADLAELRLVSSSEPIEQKRTAKLYLLKLQLNKESNSSTQSDILLVFQPKKNSYKLGVDAEYGIYISNNQDYKRVNYASNPFEIPVLIKN